VTASELDVNRNAAVYCLHCDGEFKARDIRRTRFGVCCADRNCDGGFLDLYFEPWWREDYPQRDF
jgi:hypothetical protein